MSARNRKKSQARKQYEADVRNNKLGQYISSRNVIRGVIEKHGGKIGPTYAGGGIIRIPLSYEER